MLHAKNTTTNNETIFYIQNQNEYIWINVNVNVVEFDHFKMEAGLLTCVLSPKQWAGQILICILSKLIRENTAKDSPDDVVEIFLLH